MQAMPPTVWQKQRMGRLPQQSIASRQKMSPGISMKAPRLKLVKASPEKPVEAKISPK